MCFYFVSIVIHVMNFTVRSFNYCSSSTLITYTEPHRRCTSALNLKSRWYIVCVLWVSRYPLYIIIRTDIVKLVDNKAQFVDIPFEGGFYRVIQSRSGSYWSDYEYSDPVVSKVEPYTETVTITKYRAVE